MTLFISMLLFFLFMTFGTTKVLSLTFVIPICAIFFVLMVMAFFARPKYKKRELVCVCDVLPIAENVYAIKTSNNKVVCKYVDVEDNNKVKIGIITIKVDIVQMLDGDKPTFRLYERKLVNSWLVSPSYSNIYVGRLIIPKDSMVSQ